MMPENKNAVPDKETIREQIMLAGLKHVPFDGWTMTALDAGAKAAGFDATMVRRVFPRGLSQWADCWSRWADGRMLVTLKDQDLDAMRIRDRIAAGVKARTMVNAEHREALRGCLAWLTIPLNTPIAIKNTMRTVNAIWYEAGDRSADWNYYTKRGLLAPVYATTVLYWLSDTPDDTGDYPDTWSYLDRRIQDVLTTFGLPRRFKAKIRNRMAKSGFGSGKDPLGALKRVFENTKGSTS
jgi:ubiquinone biosynthesis protein COQ9